MMIRFLLLSFLVAGLLIDDSYGADLADSSAQSQECDGGGFPSVEKALFGFATNSVSQQERAYAYVLGQSRTLDGRNVRTVLQALKTMSVTLRRVADYDAACIAGLTAEDETVRFASAMSCLQSPSLASDSTNAIARVERMLFDETAFLPAHRFELARAVAEARLQKTGDVQSILRLLDTALSWAEKDPMTVVPVPTGLARKLIDSKAGEACLGSTLASLRRCLSLMPLSAVTEFRSSVERVQPEVVAILNHLGRHDEALAECRVFVLLATPRTYQAAVSLTAETLKRADGNLGRAMAFMDFQKKDFVPKCRNILMDAPRLDDSVRAEARKALPTGRGEAWDEHLAVSVRLIWLDDPLLAVREAMYAFSLAPFEAKALQSCADAVMQPALVVTRDPAVAAGIVDYLTFGANGADGTPGTADDLSSPLESLALAMKIGRGE